MLLEQFLLLMLGWRPAFAQERTLMRLVSLVLGLLCSSARKTLSSAIIFKSGAATWAADYFVFSRSKWSLTTVFDSVFRASVKQLDELAPDEPVVVLLDDTSLKKSSRRIQQAQWLRDPLGPPFHVNLKYGLRCLHMALRLPLHKLGFAARAISILFELAPSAKKPGRRATDEERAAFPKLQKKMSLCARAVLAMQLQRNRLNALGMAARKLLVIVDGGFTNSTVLRSRPDGVEVLGRTRKDIALCLPAEPGSRRTYGKRLPTPEQMRLDPTIPYQTTVVHYGGKFREVRYKEVVNVLWQGGARRQLLRLFIIAPTPYRAPGKGNRKLAYGEPAYLICTDLELSTDFLLQCYFDRWQIEPVHRDLKTGLGLGQAQAWSSKAVPRIHGLIVAAWSTLVLASLKAFGPARTADFAPLPPWRKVKPNHRASQNDLIQLLRMDVEAVGNKIELPVPRLEAA